MKRIDLTTPELSYLFGLLQTDGHLEGARSGKGRLALELAQRDAPILRKLQRLVPVYSSTGERVRDTNFKKDYHSSVWRLYDQEVREALNAMGLPYGRKSEIVAPPEGPFSRIDYWRGIVDGDGSLGFTDGDRGFPFLSFATSSRAMAQEYLTFITSLIGKAKSMCPNTRDANYNPCVFKEDAQTVARALYYPGCLALHRKVVLARQVVRWTRPPGMRKRTYDVRRWTAEEDAVVREHSVPVTMEMLGRTEKSVRVRAFRLRHGKVGPYLADAADRLYSR